MNRPVMTFEDLRSALKQRYPMLMIDLVTALEPGKSIHAVKNVTGNEWQMCGHFPERAIFPGTLIVEAAGQAASILFAESMKKGTASDEFLVLGAIHEMRFLKPVVPGDRMEIAVNVVKFIGDFALVDVVVQVEDEDVARGKLGFARRSF